MGSGTQGGHTDAVYDVIVLGAGPAGENVADRVRAAGLSCAIVESELVGGECSFWACMPSKALLRPAQALVDARRVSGAAQAVAASVDAAATLSRRNTFVEGWDDTGQADWVAGIGAELVRGHGRLDGPRRVTVARDGAAPLRLTARHAVVVATGSRAVVPKLPGVDAAGPWTSREATSAKRVPGRLAVVGGGVVGVEMATAWQALGAHVTLLVRGSGLLPQYEPFVGELVAASLADAGVDVRLGASAASVDRPAPEAPVTVTLDDGGAVVADEVLFATGRAPRTDDLGMDTVGLRPGTWLDVDESCRVAGVDDGWLYAVGDVNHRALLTHQAKYQARIAGSAIATRAAGGTADTAPWGAHAATADSAAVPQVVFTDPEVGAVGLSSRQAEEAGLRIRVVDYDLGAVAGASLYADGYRGRARMVVDEDRGLVVGVTFVGPGIGELVYSATVVVAGQVPIDRLWHAVPAYPTISEVWLRLLEAYRG
ncbi:NAD(P)/FAD-dependent oxidoreductase [Yinghuangia sp. ASG 101]|uniref:dihydrolipoyl dehydrogenase family protein n=1 Tax=Yinghuangia sp. ASG 101 TaxID=2896848 RepID=UPI001E49EDB7|nr:NAD(P)/FAD-dependent oxidoreductase [Yinghuangia sp. ASG 101]UGQ12923.1 NAD(P)/FAD-dependent oxidoreductase [Yinghuangia sp. ASG 101]